MNSLLAILLATALLIASLPLGCGFEENPRIAVWPDNIRWGTYLRIQGPGLSYHSDLNWFGTGPISKTMPDPGHGFATNFVNAGLPQGTYSMVAKTETTAPQYYTWKYTAICSGENDAILTWELENEDNLNQLFVPPDYSVVLENLSRAYYENIHLNLREMDNYEFTFTKFMGFVVPWKATLYVDNAVNVTISPSYQENEVGGQLTYTVVIQNTGRYDDIYTLTASDDLGWDLTLSDDLLSIPAGGSDNVKLNVSVESYATDSVMVAAVGAYASDSNNVKAEGVAPHLPGVSVSVSISPDENEIAPGSTAAFTVTVTNEGEVVDVYDLLVTNNAGWGVALDDSELMVPAGESRQTTLSVTVPSDVTESESTEVTVTATSQAHPTVEDSAKCLVMVKGGGEAPSPGFPWLPIAAVFIVLVVLIGVILVIRPF